MLLGEGSQMPPYKHHTPVPCTSFCLQTKQIISIIYLHYYNKYYYLFKKKIAVSSDFTGIYSLVFHNHIIVSGGTFWYSSLSRLTPQPTRLLITFQSFLYWKSISYLVNLRMQNVSRQCRNGYIMRGLYFWLICFQKWTCPNFHAPSLMPFAQKFFCHSGLIHTFTLTQLQISQSFCPNDANGPFSNVTWWHEVIPWCTMTSWGGATCQFYMGSLISE